jgi:catechol 2,3-dioxygenase-like lactoylglutathione lyase family enzyme
MEGWQLKVKRIVANFAATDPAQAKMFYGDILGLDLLMNMDWIHTYGANLKMDTQVSFASQGGSDTPVPDLSIEVDDLETAFKRFKDAGFPIEYGPIQEPWGVRRFYVRDPIGKLVNILEHL